VLDAADAFKDDLEVVGGVLAKECAELYIKPNEPVPPEKLRADPAR